MCTLFRFQWGIQRIHENQPEAVKMKRGCDFYLFERYFMEIVFNLPDSHCDRNNQQQKQGLSWSQT